MRKVILAMVLILPLVFQSCKDEDEISLIGTEWVMKANLEAFIYETHLKFVDETHGMFIYYSEDGQEIEDTEEVTYVLSGSNIVLTFVDAVDIITLSGTIDGNKMTLAYDDEPDGLQYVFTKM